MFRNQPELLMARIGTLPEYNDDFILERLADMLSFWSQEEWDAACQRMRTASLSPEGAVQWENFQLLVASHVPPKTPPEALEMMAASGNISMTLLAPEGGGRYDVDPQAGNGPNRVHYFPVGFDWKPVVDAFVRRSPITLMLSGQDETFHLCFYPGSCLVLLQNGGRDQWFEAIPRDSPEDVFARDIFSFMRLWYDEAEYAALRAGISIPDQGQSWEEIAKAWADAYEGAALNATSGSMYACTYVRNENAALADWINALSEEEKNKIFPESTAGHERFAFMYTTVFVPENDGAQNWMWAGNTDYYTGSDAPEGAFRYSRCGYMYRTGDGWRCDGVGTSL